MSDDFHEQKVGLTMAIGDLDKKIYALRVQLRQQGGYLAQIGGLLQTHPESVMLGDAELPTYDASGEIINLHPSISNFLFDLEGLNQKLHALVALIHERAVLETKLKDAK